MNPSWISIAVLGIVQLIAIVGAYYGLKADNAKLAAALELAITSERADRKQDLLTHKASVDGLIAVIDQSLKDLGRRVGTLEAGQDEWTKMLRDRTHELAGQINQLVLKVDRLERPAQG